MADPVDEWRSKTVAFAAAAHELFALHETSKASRVISLTQTWKELEGLSLLQESLFRDALHCIERGIYRAAHVMAWAGFMDLLEEKLASDGLKALYIARPKWKVNHTIEEIRENVVEYQLLEAARDLGLLSKTATKTLHGLLSKRNECAHPSGFEPDLNQSLGYVSELIARIATLQTKSL